MASPLRHSPSPPLAFLCRASCGSPGAGLPRPAALEDPQRRSSATSYSSCGRPSLWSESTEEPPRPALFRGSCSSGLSSIRTEAAEEFRTSDSASSCPGTGWRPPGRELVAVGAPGGELRADRCECDLADGTRYAGQWLREQPDGQGVQLWPDGGRYTGEFQVGQAHGHGTLRYANGDVYEGLWAAGKAEGEGTCAKADGSTYKGRWAGGKQHGDGVLTHRDGTTYKGQFKDGAKSGSGVMVFQGSKAGCMYEGQFRGELLHGEGTYRWGDGRVYEGQWRGSKMHGRGSFTFPDGRAYVGQYEDDQKSGAGRFEWPDGRCYEGGFQAGKQHGRGVLIGPGGERQEGVWSMGSLSDSASSQRPARSQPGLRPTLLGSRPPSDPRAKRRVC